MKLQGAHIAGYAGARTQNLGRITGLDPAGPYFENTDTVVRLDKTDAKFVDVIHTDGASTLQLGLGLMQMSGHVDFYGIFICFFLFSFFLFTLSLNFFS